MLAAHLHRTTAELAATLSAREFARWALWMHAEQVGPHWDRLRHAELMAAAHNGTNVKHRDARPFSALDFFTADPWSPPPAPMTMTAEQVRQMHDAHLATEQDWLDRDGGRVHLA